MISAKSLALTASIAALAATQGVAAKNTSATEVRGFNACVAAAKDNGLKGISTRSTYYLRETNASNIFYLNVYAWEGSERVSKRIRCETSTSGFKLLSADLADGHYDTDERSVLRLAGSQSDGKNQVVSTAGR